MKSILAIFLLLSVTPVWAQTDPAKNGDIPNPVYSSPAYGSRVTPNYPGLQNLFIQSFAAYTGGVVCSFRLDRCFKNAVDDSSQYYLLSYYADPAEKAGWRKMHVKVEADHVYAHAPATTPWARRSAMKTAVSWTSRGPRSRPSNIRACR